MGFYQDSVEELRKIFNKLNLVMNGEPAIRFTETEILRLLTTEKAYCDYVTSGNIGYLRLIDIDGDGMITPEEINNVKSLSNRPDNNSSIFAGNSRIETFHEFRYFTGLNMINNGCFNNCSSLKEVTLPVLTQMGNDAFQSSGIEKVIIPEGYQTIGDTILNNAQSCRLLDIPSTVTSIGKNILWGVKEITTIVCRAIIPPALNGSFGYNGIPVAIYVPDESVAAYKAATNWSSQSGKIYPLSTYSS